MVDEKLHKIIDKYMLAFIDEYEAAFNELPSELIRNVWMAGFVDGCSAIDEGLKARLDARR